MDAAAVTWASLARRDGAADDARPVTEAEADKLPALPLPRPGCKPSAAVGVVPVANGDSPITNTLWLGRWAA